MKNFFFGSKENKPEGGGNPLAGKPTPPGEDSFLTGDEIRDRKNVQLLLEAIGEVSAMRSLETLLSDIVDKAIELTRAERGILLIEKDGKIQIEIARDHRKAGLIPPIQYGTTLAKQVAASKKPLRKMLSSDSEAADLSRSVFDLKLRAVMCAPLLVKDKLVGLIYVDSKAQEREFSRADLSFFHALSRQLAIAIENARLVADSVEKARLEQEMRIAGEIQKGLFPQKPAEIPGVKLSGWYMPCEDATGDSFDFFPLEGGRAGFMLGDVSGHGIGPALVAASARAALRSYLKVVPDLGRVADLLGKDLEADLTPGMFLTFFLGVFDPKSGELCYLNAGHPSPVLARRGEAPVLLEGVESAFGFRDGTPAKAMRIALRPGDLLVVYSDGLVEARNGKGELFGDARLLEAVARLRANGSALLDTLVKESLQFSGQKRGDDLTLLALEVPG